LLQPVFGERSTGTEIVKNCFFYFESVKTSLKTYKPSFCTYYSSTESRYR